MRNLFLTAAFLLLGGCSYLGTIETKKYPFQLRNKPAEASISYVKNTGKVDTYHITMNARNLSAAVVTCIAPNYAHYDFNRNGVPDAGVVTVRCPAIGIEGRPKYRLTTYIVKPNGDITAVTPPECKSPADTLDLVREAENTIRDISRMEATKNPSKTKTF